MGLAALCLAGLAAPAHADDTVYRWVDEAGRVHYGNQVPEAYRHQAKPLPAAAEPSAEDQRAALVRASRDQAHAQAAAASAAEEAASRAAAARAAATQAAARTASTQIVKRPSHVPNEHTDCDSWLVLYWESENCFGPYHTAKGGLKPEAYMHCNEVPAPPLRCQAPWFQWGR